MSRFLSRKDFLVTCGAFASAPLLGEGFAGAPLVRFGVFTDSHYADLDPMGSDEPTARYYRDSVDKVRKFVEIMNARKVDFVIELGDFKDDSGANTLAKLDEIETAFAQFDGPRYHVLGNHDADVISRDDFLSHVTNTGFPVAMPHYSFTKGGVRFIVLDACYDSTMQPYDKSNPWTDSNIPEEQLSWLRGELRRSRCPTVVFCHQLLCPGGGSDYTVKQAETVRGILEGDSSVHAVLMGHTHDEAACHHNGIYYHTFGAMVKGPKSGYNAFSEVAVFASGAVSVTGFSTIP